MNFLSRVYENFKNVDTIIRKVNPINTIKFSEDQECEIEKKRKFFVEKSLLFNMYLRAIGYYKNNGDNFIPIDDKYDIMIPDNEKDSISFSLTDDIYPTHDSLIAINNCEKHVFYVVRYLKSNLFYGILGSAILTGCTLIYVKFFNKK